MSKISVIHDTVRKVFKAVSTEGSELGHVEYRLVPTKKAVEFYHTFTDPNARGMGVGALVVRDGLQWAKDSNLSVIPSCSYVASYIEKSRSRF